MTTNNTDITSTDITTTDIINDTEIKSIFKIDLDVLKSEIEKSINPKTVEESIYLFLNPDKSKNKMQQGADMFKEKTGRNMTYSEMRQMYG